VHYLTSAYFSVLTWWLGRRSRLTHKSVKSSFPWCFLPLTGFLHKRSQV
jgi:hypothetical protein